MIVDVLTWRLQYSVDICDYGNTVLITTPSSVQEVGVAEFPGALDYNVFPLITSQLLSCVCRGRCGGQRYRGQASDDLCY